MRSIVSFLLLIMVVSVHAQTMPQPEFFNEVLFVNQENELTNLEKTGLKVESKFKIGGASKVYYQAEGCCSKVSHSGKSTDRYVIKVQPGTNPTDIIELYKFEKGKKDRKLTIGKITLGKAISGNTATDIPTVTLSFKKIADGVYTIQHDDLTEGEYMFMIKAGERQQSASSIGSQQYLHGYCFSVI